MVYCSDLIDLNDIDLDALRELPSAVLRAAVARVRRELSGGGDEPAIYADFRSSLPTRATRHADSSDGGEGGEVDAIR